MPRPRYAKLPSARRDRILESAAREFSAHGYGGASLNRILESAGLSKGAAYYYFDDKADLFLTVVRHYGQELMAIIAPRLGDVSRHTSQDSFWSVVEDVYRLQYREAAERPWVFGVLKAAAKLPEGATARSELGEYLGQVMGFLSEFLRAGQSVGAVRTDLPLELLAALLMAVDEAHDQWLIKNIAEIRTPAGIEQAASQASGSMRRILSC